MSVVNLRYRLIGGAISRDHAAALHAAVVKAVPAVRADRTLGLLPLYGRLGGKRRLEFSRANLLLVRADVCRVPALLKLAGRHLEVGEQVVRLGCPAVHDLEPVECLYSRLVVLASANVDPAVFLRAAQRALDRAEVSGKAQLVACPGNSPQYVRGTVRFRNRSVNGFALLVAPLSSEHSLRLQEVGLGLHRALGCGIFVPNRE